MNEQEMQSKLMEFEMIKQQLTQLDQQRSQINMRLMDSDAAFQTLTDLESVEKSVDAFIPLGSGLFSRASITDAKNVLVNVGHDIAVEKPITEARALMSEMKTGYEKMFSDVEQDISMLQNHAESIYSIIEKENAQKK